MHERVKVRRDHPGALTWAIAMVVTMLAVYLITLESGAQKSTAPVTTAQDTGARVTQEISLEGINLSCVTFGTYTTAQEANIEAAQYVGRGAAGYVVSDGQYSVLAAGYDNNEDALRVAESLSAAEGIECSTYRKEASGVRLRITATEGQIASIVEADAALRRHASDLRALSLMLDQSETQVSSACTLIAVMAGQLQNSLLELRDIPGGEQSPVVSGLIGMVERAQAALSLLSTENSQAALSLSGKIKYNHIEMTLLHIDYLNALNGV